jgi:hypothetical protein
MDSNLGWADHSGHQRSPSRYAGNFFSSLQDPNTHAARTRTGARELKIIGDIHGAD